VASFFRFEEGRGCYLFAARPVNRFRCFVQPPSTATSFPSGFLFSGEPLPFFRPVGRGFYLFAASAVNRSR
jgi:hypothetical protein